MSKKDLMWYYIGVVMGAVAACVSITRLSPQYQKAKAMKKIHNTVKDHKSTQQFKKIKNTFH